ncbi:Sef1p [Kluyveromyces lactis]|uniref:Putative transcription factor SEF1 n=1 Tax=Kluyveromyces lactis (strain ATCC 8585 / CBS 2359 / DSM 70799 / NBRC 1267 / NRRL Y-1140 / WM37) TaxID=284590 RepID=SEF1_KLULA|nr:uncharacterized protein KLLA0_E20307g [Kluyveromyces lactis]P87164.3 RecName: Full=Putative transcription factor SEF1; AltName: Full=Suppressor protein SEF1 [Kluyveromyces lactis NRRL Y-1140]CAR56749.1 KLLA0E20307p [Kluyveromyces lactis]|eukprot:XP_002999411.1 uncharacterized protein KLLA0_E20307g [Kluyveromyces lactis]
MGDPVSSKRKSSVSDAVSTSKRQHQQVKVEDVNVPLSSREHSPGPQLHTQQSYYGNGTDGASESALTQSRNNNGATSVVAISDATQNGEDSSNISNNSNAVSKGKAVVNAGHRPVTSCTHCRQHKIKCNASEKFPAPCSRCERMGLHCEIDPQFRPKKGSQLQSLRNDVDELKVKIEYLTRNESLIAKALKQSNIGQNLLQAIKSVDFSYRVAGPTQGQVAKNKISVQTYLTNEPQLLQDSQTTTTNPTTSSNSKVVTPTGSDHSPASHNGGSLSSGKPQLLNDSVPANTKDRLPPVLQIALKRLSQQISSSSPQNSSPTTTGHSPANDLSSSKQHVVATTNAMPLLPSPHANIDEFVLGDVHISIEKATELHNIFVARFLPYFPIMQSNSATELYSQSQLLFWTVILTASLSDPEPTLYNKLSSLIKQLAIETCWIRTPRSTHISQALLILCNWPLPNQKVLDDCSYRFVGLAKSLSFQLGLHRGKFMTEFTRTQTSLPEAEKWRTRTWLGIFFAEQLWASILGLPPTSQTDYLIEKARLGDDGELPPILRKLICLANFQGKLCNVMGTSVVSPDGLMDARERAGSLAILERELERLDVKLKFQEDAAVEIYFLYIKLMICCFAFLPETPTEDQTKYVTEAYLCATKIITLLTKLLETQQLIELPIYIRHSATYSALILFKLYLTPLLLDKYVDSARQSIVTVHRLYRNQLTAWAASVENDISRTASVLEKLNFVLVTHPEVFIEEEGIISRMRSHLTGTLFYDLVWCVHEARRRQMDPNYDAEAAKRNKEKWFKNRRKLYPLPFYNQISKEDFETITQTTPGGTTVTTLVPTKSAIKQAKQLAQSQGDQNGPVTHINGIPLSMLDETGSVNIEGLLANANLNLSNEHSTVLASSSSTATRLNADNPTTDTNKFNVQTVFTHNIKKSSKSSDTPTNKPKFNSTSSIPTATPTSEQRAAHNTKTSASILTGDPNSLFSMNNSLQANIQLNKTLSADSNGTSNNNIPNSTAPLNTPDTNSFNSLTRSPDAPSYGNMNVFYNAANQGTNMNTLYSQSVPNAPQGISAPLSAQPVNVTNIPNGNVNSELDDFFLRQSAGWIEGNSSNDDFLGWFDMNMAPEF